jgi:hypothetical protein
MPSLLQAQELVQELADGLAEWLSATWAGLPPATGWVALALLVLGGLIGAAIARPARLSRALPPPATPPAEQPGAARVAALEAELAAARDGAARQQHDADAGVQAFCAVLAPALSALSEAAEQGRVAAAECAARADAVHAYMHDAAEDAARTATTLGAVTTHVESLALSVEAIATALDAVAEAIRPEGEGEGAASGSGQSLVRLAGESSKALADLVSTLHATAASADAVASRIIAVRDATEAGSAAAQAMAHATDTVGRNAITVGLEFATFLDGLSRAGNRRKFDRYPTDLAATIVVEGTSHAARIVDISRGGCAMDGDPGLDTGTQVMLRLPGVERELEARVARRLGSITGLEFIEPDPLAGLLETLIVGRASAA